MSSSPDATIYTSGLKNAVFSNTHHIHLTHFTFHKDNVVIQCKFSWSSMAIITKLALHFKPVIKKEQDFERAWSLGFRR